MDKSIRMKYVPVGRPKPYQDASDSIINTNIFPRQDIAKKMNTDINKLRELVRYHERKYYIDDQPEISDTDLTR